MLCRAWLGKRNRIYQAMLETVSLFSLGGVLLSVKMRPTAEAPKIFTVHFSEIIAYGRWEYAGGGAATKHLAD